MTTRIINGGDNHLKKIHEQLSLILKNQKQMADELKTLNDQISLLNTKVDELQATIDAEQADIAALLNTNASVVAGLKDQVATLQAQLAGVITPEALQSAIDTTNAIIAKIEAASADVASTV